MAMSVTPRFLIVGQGLAGTALAWRLLDRGVAVLLVDRHEPATSSKVAAGLVTPVTGMRLNLNWRYPELAAEARGFYRTCEARLGGLFYHEVPIVRLLRDAQAAALWAQRREQPEVRPWLDPDAPEPLVDARRFRDDHGGFQQRGGGWLDTAAFLEASRAHFERLGCWRQGEVGPGDLATEPEAVVWRGERFDQAVFCTGWEAARHPAWDWLPFESARGSVLALQADLGGESRVINRGCWVLPRPDGTFRAGPTYERTFDDPATPGAEALAGLDRKLRALLRADFRVTGVQTGVRPIVRGRKAVLGRHPGRPRLACLNGLGSKGVLRAPWMARHLAEHLLDGAALEAGLDAAAND